MKHLVSILFLLVLFSGCRKGFIGDEIANLPPETFTVVDTIARTGENRLTSQITANWYGADPDGFVNGYELNFGGTEWIFTTRQDTTFVVDIPEGQDTFDFVFRIRAVDNEGLADPTPASLAYPVKNSPPNISFAYSASAGATASRNPVFTFPVSYWSWSYNDPDGVENIDHIEIIWNDTARQPVILDQLYTSVTLEGIDWEADTTSTRIYPGTQERPLNLTIPGLKLDDTNRLFIRVVDGVGAASPWKASYPLYIRKQTSDILVVNANSVRIATTENFYLTNLQQAGITNNVQVMRANEIRDNNYTELAPNNFSQSLIFAHFDHMLWFGNNAEYVLSLGQRTTGLFFNNGGNMFLATNFSSSIQEQAGFLTFTPIDSLVNPATGSVFRLTKDAEIQPLLPGWPVLKTNSIVSSARPFYERPGAQPICNAQITVTTSSSADPWMGKSTVMAKRDNSLGQTTFVISSLELENLNGNNNMAEFFTKVFVDLLRFND